MDSQNCYTGVNVSKRNSANVIDAHKVNPYVKVVLLSVFHKCE